LCGKRLPVRRRTTHPKPTRFVSVLCVGICAILALSPAASVQSIRALLIGAVDGGTDLEVFLKAEPLVEFVSVPCSRWKIEWDLETQMKYIRQYFPRNYEYMRSFDYIMLHNTEYYYLTNKQDRWIHDRVVEGAGGWNDESVLSTHTVVHIAWANSMAQQAFPNDAPAVVASGRIGIPSPYYKVKINKAFPDPVLTPYIPYGVEEQTGAVSRYIISREGSRAMAYQYGNFPRKGDTPFLVAWDYGKGRTITCGGAMDLRNSWFKDENPYAPDMITNIALYSTHRKLIKDVEVFHRIKSYFREFRERLTCLVSLTDFIEKFGANTNRIQSQIQDIRDMSQLATERYLEQDFLGSEEVMSAGFDRFVEVESLALKVKSSALWWVYSIEWLVTTSIFSISGFLLWTLMVRRRLYQAVPTTRMK